MSLWVGEGVRGDIGEGCSPCADAVATARSLRLLISAGDKQRLSLLGLELFEVNHTDCFSYKIPSVERVSSTLRSNQSNLSHLSAS